MESPIPIILFTYDRPDHLRRTLGSLKADHVPLIYIFSDGAKTQDKEPSVNEVRAIIHEIDWCTTIITERGTNFGLGRSILTGITDVLQKEEMVIVFEDDLICVPGMYDYLSAALRVYRNDTRVMSVAGWTHDRITPSDISDQPYFDGRTESWVWGTWARVWPEMINQDAESLMHQCERSGIDITRYGLDVPEMAKVELTKNIWWVRFMFLHMVHHGLCLRPPWSMVEHIGYDHGTNVKDKDIWASGPLKPCPPIPEQWPDPVEDTECPLLWQRCYGTRMNRLKYRGLYALKTMVRSLGNFYKFRLFRRI